MIQRVEDINKKIGKNDKNKKQILEQERDKFKMWFCQAKYDK